MKAEDGVTMTKKAVRWGVRQLENGQQRSRVNQVALPDSARQCGDV